MPSRQLTPFQAVGPLVLYPMKMEEKEQPTRGIKIRPCSGMSHTGRSKRNTVFLRRFRAKLL